MADLFFSEYIEGTSNNKALEIYNGTGAAIDLAATGYVVQMYFNGSTTAGLTIPLTGTVANGDVFVLTQSSANATILAQADQTNGAGWFNGDDAVVLRRGGATGTVVDAIGQIGFDPGTEWGSGLTSTADNTLRRKGSVTMGDTNQTDAFDPSVEWEGFPTDTFDGLGSYTSGGTTPPPPPPQITAIYDIQGAGHLSPLVNQSVTTTGIVTAVDSNGFYLQDPTGDSRNETSDGIFVFTSSRPSVRVGDELQVAGTVSEFIPGGASSNNLSITQLTSPTITTRSTGNTLPAATVIGAGGRTPPTQVIDNDNFNPYDPEQDGIDFYESLEGMRVTVQDALAVSPTNNFGEIFTVADNGATATGLSGRGTINIAPDDFNPERIQIQFDSGILPDFEQQVNVGAQLGDVTGVVTYAFGNFEVAVTEAFTPVQQSTLQPEVSTLQGTADQLTVASYNVLNLDPNDGDGSQDIADGQFEQIASQIVNNLNSPDVIGLQEIQDNDGSVNSSVTSAEVTLQTLADAIAAAGGPRYEFIDNPFIGDDTNGGQPGGNIRTAFLYNPDRVDFVEGSLQTVTDPQQQQQDSRNFSDYEAGRNPFLDSRLPLSATFRFNGQEFTAVSNHFTSKGGSAPLFGQLQPSVDPGDPNGGQEDPDINGGVEARRAQAEAVNNYVEGILATDPNANVAVLGDLNEFEFISPLEILEGNELNNLTETLPENERYSYIFQGNSQSLDHILVTDNLLAGAEFDPVHVNSEFIDQASDHDPLLSRFTLPVPAGVINGTPASEELMGTVDSDRIFGRGGNDTLRGLQGDDWLFGGTGNDVINGNQGNDRLFGEQGNDRLSGDNGDDFLDGESGNDTLLGGNGNDILLGQEGDDILSGGNGDDLLDGGVGNDSLSGGQGSDGFVLTLGAGIDTIQDFASGVDLIQLQGLTFEQLSIAQGAGANQSDTLININNGTELLAILAGVQAGTITGADFMTA
jgi:uncharacterized protein